MVVYSSVIAISIHAPHTGRDETVDEVFRLISISIHAPHTGRDSIAWACPSFLYISIHAPHTGRDVRLRDFLFVQSVFQSTRPIRGATWNLQSIVTKRLFQSTRPIRGATPYRWSHTERLKISIHAPHTGRDTIRNRGYPLKPLFQSTRPIRGATCNFLYIEKSLYIISIHAPHTGRDAFLLASRSRPLAFQSTRPIRGATAPRYRRRARCCHFNPRAPYGARLYLFSQSFDIDKFQSTRPIRGATDRYTERSRNNTISIHAPHTGRDLSWCSSVIVSAVFQSTRPIRGATMWTAAFPRSMTNFNPRAPYGARHGTYSLEDYSFRISIHAPHTGRD